MIKNLKFGTDAEFFLRTKTGQPFPVTGLIGGTKEAPEPIPGLPTGFAMQEDNAAAEVNIPPSSSIPTICKSITAVFEGLSKVLPRALELDFSSSSLEFPEKYIEQIQELSIFGCDPDYNAWEMCLNDKPVPKTIGFRSAAGHVHLGWDDPNDDDRLELIRWSDVCVILPFLTKENESEVARRSLYGRAGAFRFKDYGVEHRVPSNQWLVRDTRIRFTLMQYLKAVAAVNAGIVIPEADYGDIQNAINNHDAIVAGRILAEYTPRLESNEAWGDAVWALEDEHLKEDGNPV